MSQAASFLKIEGSSAGYEIRLNFMDSCPQESAVGHYVKPAESCPNAVI